MFFFLDQESKNSVVVFERHKLIELGSYNRIPSIAFHIRNEDSVVAVIAENGFYLFQSHLFALKQLSGNSTFLTSRSAISSTEASLTKSPGYRNSTQCFNIDVLLIFQLITRIPVLITKMVHLLYFAVPTNINYIILRINIKSNSQWGRS